MLQARGLAIENTVHKGLNLKAFNGKALKPIAVRVNNQESTQYSMLWGGGILIWWAIGRVYGRRRQQRTLVGPVTEPERIVCLGVWPSFPFTRSPRHTNQRRAIFSTGGRRLREPVQCSAVSGAGTLACCWNGRENPDHLRGSTLELCSI